jgi:uncharacterized protein (TIGR00255 family)
MIRSMTAFARQTCAFGAGQLTVELRSVNHRYLEPSFKLPDALRQLEPRLRDGLRDALNRGKVDCMIRLQGDTQQDTGLQINTDRLSQLLQAIAHIDEHLETTAGLDPLAILEFPGVLARGDDSSEELIHAALSLFQGAIAGLQESREREGQKLAAMIQERLLGVQAEVTAARNRMPQLLQQQQERVRNKLAELDIEIDRDRLEQELVHLAQKADVDEELDRLEAHVEEVSRCLKKGGPCGRRLDFLMQELNREANTLSSKSLSSSTTQNAVELKVLIEQMREQIQNIE